MKCGGMKKYAAGGTTKKMKPGGMPDKIMGPPKKPFAAGIPYYIGAGQTGPESMKKGGAKKAAGGPILDKLKAKLAAAKAKSAERKITKQIKKSVKSSGKIIK